MKAKKTRSSPRKAPKIHRSSHHRSGQPQIHHSPRHHHPHPGPSARDPQFVTLKRLIRDFQNDTNPNKKLALAISGGGARGSYEAGVIEAMLQEFRLAGIAPQIVTGTSAGSIVATCLFVDLLFPLAPGASDPGLPPEVPGPVPYASRQSQVWRNMAAGNAGAQQLFGIMSWLVEFVTGQKPWPVIGTLFDEIQVLTANWSTLKTQLTTLGSSVQAVVNAAGAGAPFFADVTTAVNSATGGPSGAFQTSVTQLMKDWGDLDLSLVNIASDVSQLSALVGDVEAVVANLPSPSSVASATIAAAQSELGTLSTYLQTLTGAVAGLRGPLSSVIGTTGRLTGAALEIAACIEAIALAAAFLAENLLPVVCGVFGIAIAAGVAAVEMENILPATNLLALLASVMGGACPPGQTVLTKWRSMSTQSRPELLLGGTDMTSQRQMVFAIANKTTLESLATDDTWVTDLTGYTDPATANTAITSQSPSRVIPTEIFTPLNTATMANLSDHSLIAKATMTSSALPFAFPPQRWYLGHLDPNTPAPRVPATATAPAIPAIGPAMESFLPHIFMDGGIVDNSPIDLAVVAGATHVVSIELHPLPSFGDDFRDAYFLRDDNETFGFGKIAYGVFNIGMSGSLMRSIEDVVEANASLSSGKQIRIYRMAPLVPDSANIGGNSVDLSVGIIDFDGAYNPNNGIIQNLYDWFMQGYVDAKSYGSEPAPGTDPVYTEYKTNQGILGCVGPSSLQFTGNQFWFTGDEPLPGIADYENASPPVVLPNLQAMATRPPYNG
jgi:predicted acylesterase/phospholipase RssA